MVRNFVGAETEGKTVLDLITKTSESVYFLMQGQEFALCIMVVRPRTIDSDDEKFPKAFNKNFQAWTCRAIKDQ